MVVYDSLLVLDDVLMGQLPTDGLIFSVPVPVSISFCLYASSLLSVSASFWSFAVRAFVRVCLCPCLRVHVHVLVCMCAVLGQGAAAPKL